MMLLPWEENTKRESQRPIDSCIEVIDRCMPQSKFAQDFASLGFINVYFCTFNKKGDFQSLNYWRKDFPV